MHSLKALTSPLLILHAEDDRIVPYHMGLKVQPLRLFKIISSWISPPPLRITLLFFVLSLQLHQISLEAKKKSNTDVQVQMVSYSAKLGYNHNGIHLDPDLTNVVGWVWATLTSDACQSIKGTYHPIIKILSLTLMCLGSQARFRSRQNTCGVTMRAEKIEDWRWRFIQIDGNTRNRRTQQVTPQRLDLNTN